MKNKTVLLSVLTVGLSLCYTCASRALGPKDATKSNQFTVMTFNVENLFDTKHDSGKDDHTFLPKAEKKSPEHARRCEKIEVKKWKKQCLEFDWSEEVLGQKMKNLTSVVKSVDSGRGPDLLVLQEVENVGVLSKWSMQYLKAMNYQPPILIEGSDARGIDVALVSRFLLVGTPKLHPVPFVNMPDHRKKDARGILEATFSLPGGDTLRVFAVHFPAPYHDPEFRRQSLVFLNELLNRAPGDLTLAAGDFNIPSDENDRERFIENLIEPLWTPVHKFCADCLGTTYYAPKKNWSFLDMILVSKSFTNASWSIDKKSIRVVNGLSIQKNKKGHPKSFEWPQGVSDHFPLTLTMRR